MKLPGNKKLLRIAGIIQVVNWALFLFPTTLLMFYLGHYSTPWRLFIMLMMGTVLIISIHSIRGEMKPRLRFIFLLFHGLLILQSVFFLGAILVIIIMQGGLPALS